MELCCCETSCYSWFSVCDEYFVFYSNLLYVKCMPIIQGISAVVVGIGTHRAMFVKNSNKAKKEKITWYSSGQNCIIRGHTRVPTSPGVTSIIYV